MAREPEGRERRLPKGVIAAAAFLLGVLVLVLLFRGEAGDNVEVGPVDFDVAAFEGRVEQRLDPVPLQPVAALRIRVTSLRWMDGAGRPFLSVPSAVLTLQLPGPGEALRITAGEVVRPEVHLVRYASGAWNYERSLEPLLNGDGGGGTGGGSLAVRLANIVVRGGVVTIDLPERGFAARDLDARISTAVLSGPGVDAPTFQVASAEAVLELPDTAAGTVTRPVSLSDATIRVLEGGVAFDVDRATFGGSTFADASGIWDPALGGWGLDVELRAERFLLADLPWLRAEVPADASGSFRVSIEPAAGGGTAVALSGLTLTAPGSSATGSLRVILGEAGIAIESIDMRVDPLSLSLIETVTGPLPYSGTLRGTLTGTGGDIRFDLLASLRTTPASDPFQTRLAGEVAFTPTGLSLEEVTATLDRVPLSALQAMAPGLPLSGPVSGTVTLTGMPSEEPIRLDVRLEAGGGIANVAGIVDLTGAVPSYDLEGRLVGVELRTVLEPAMPPAQIHATFSLEGTGTELATANAAIRLNGSFTGWRSEPGDTVAIQAVLARGVLDVDAGRIELGPISASAAGEWALVGGGGGALSYDVEVASLEPLAPYLPLDEQGRARFARGSLDAEGTLSGTLDAPVLAGTVEARDFRFGEWAAERLQGEYSADLAGGGLPTIEAEIQGTEIRTPSGDFETLSLNVDFTRPTFAFALRADQLDGGVVEIEAAGRIEDAGSREIEVRVVEIDLEDQRWRLPSPATIAWTAGEAVRVEGLGLERVGGEGILRVDGIIAPLDEADFALDVRQLPIGELLALGGIDYEVEGELSITGEVRGPSESPFVSLDLLLNEGTVRDVAVRSVEAQVRYEGTELTIEGTGILGDSAFVELSGLLPARLALGPPPSFELIDGREIQAHLVTDDFPLATLDPGIRSVQDLEGLLRADVRIGGTPDEPRLTGDIELVDGEVTIPLLEKRYTGIEGLADLNGRELTIRRFVAESGGTATVAGVLTFEELTDPAFDLTATLDAFQPQGVSNAANAAAYGTLRLSGSVSDPLLSGEVVMDDGTLSLVPFTGGAQFSDQLVGVAESLAPLGDDFDLAPEEPGIRISNLEIRAGDDLWFATQEARAQLRGTLLAETAGGDLTLRGTLVGEQGTFDLRVGPVRRQFNIVAASIRFLGSPEPNPAIDITASRRVPTLDDGGIVDVRVRVTGTLSNPQLGLSSAEGVAVGESELLSLILFGRQTFTGADVVGQQNLVSDLAVLAGVTDWATEWAGQADFIEELDRFQIQMRSAGSSFLDVGNLWLVAGEQFWEEFLGTVEFPIQGGEDLWVATLEWRIDRQWTVELSRGPVHYIGRVGTGSMPLSDPAFSDRQTLIVIRRRWTY